MGLRRRTSQHDAPYRALGWMISLALGTSITLTVLCHEGAPVLGVSYWLVPDGVSLAETCAVITRLGVKGGFDDIPGYQFGFPPSALLLLVHSLSLSVIGPLGFTLVNLAVLTGTMRLTSPWLALALPYLLVALTMPSKEILLAPLLFLGWQALSRHQFVLLSLIVSVVFFVRDGAGIAILAWIIGCGSAVALHLRGIVVVTVAAALGFLLHANLETFSNQFFLIDRNVIGASSVDSPLSGNAFSSLGYLSRLIVTLSGLAMRPAPFFDCQGYVPLLGVSFWICGVTILVSAIDSIQLLLSQPTSEWPKCMTDARNAALALWLAIAVFAVNPMVQPRYVVPFSIPYLAWMFANRRPSSLVRLYSLCVGLSIAGVLAQQLLGIQSVEPWLEGPLWSSFEGLR